jgi:hypothetical protein
MTSPDPRVQTSGGATVGQSVETGGGAFVGRDLYLGGQPPGPPPIPTPPAAPQLFGRGQTIDELVTHLTRGASVAVWGLAGVGKTALALALANDPRIAAAFPGSARRGCQNRSSRTLSVVLITAIPTAPIPAMNAA